jgi:hypothetical protein
MKRYFSDFFEVSPEIIEEYGAFNVSLVADLPLFIDPFLLFNSDKEEYRKLHDRMIEYLLFLKNKSTDQNIDKGLIGAWYRFPEVKQNWLGFSAKDNRGSGLGKKFAVALHNNLHRIFKDFGSEPVTHGSHLEKLCLISGGVGKDNISDFTTNLIKDFLLDYTQEFTRRYINEKFHSLTTVSKVRFNYNTETWEPGTYDLPRHDGDYVLLTPIDILTKDDTWINRSELVKGFERIPAAIPDEHLRSLINNYFRNLLPQVDDDRKQKKKHEHNAAVETILKFPELIDFYIRQKEENGDQAENISSYKVAESKRLYLEQFSQLGEDLASTTNFYNITGNTYQGAMERILIIKDIVENRDGHSIFYFNGEPIEREEDLHILYRLTWRAAASGASSEISNVNSAMVPRGGKKGPLIEMKLARNPQLRRSLEKQVKEYDESNETQKSIKVIVYFSQDELDRVRGMINELRIGNHKNIVLIDARHDKKRLETEAMITKNGGFENGYALLIGIGSDLPVTVQDATALRDVLIDPTRAAYPQEQVQLLTEENARRRNILDAFDQLIEKVNQNPGATVIIYYSGHGGRINGLNQSNDYFLVPYGYDPSQRAETAISGQEFTDKIQSINAHKLIVLLDCCHAGGVPALKESEEVFVKSPVPPDLLEVLKSGHGQVVVASSHENEYSYTGDPYSVFTACLIEALEGKATLSKDGYARVLDVLSYLFAQVPQRTLDKQHPFVNKVSDLSGNFPICYYAGGSKQVPGEPAIPEIETGSMNALTDGQRVRLQQELNGLQSEWNTRHAKAGRIRLALAIETSAAAGFQQEQQLLAEEAQLAKLSDRMQKIEQELQLSK